MILSVSRRTDIPAFYADWFINRLKEGFVYVRNPMNIHQVSKIPQKKKKIEYLHFIYNGFKSVDEQTHHFCLNASKEWIGYTKLDRKNKGL